MGTATARSDWWSLRPLHRPSLPQFSRADTTWARTPLDVFILAKLREKGLSPSPEADWRTLIRRLTFDLHGLPPTPQEIETFLSDQSPNAYERLVERLLASPRYGERWARHWLDVVHYGDTHGYDKDKPRPNAWPYRDYVIRAFNADKPYARFVQEQLAGDVLFPDTVDGVVATGFLAAGPWDFIGHVELPETKIDGQIARHLDRDDMVANTMNTFVSLTVQCAQCHNHKFDPISQEDYYSLHAVFAALDRADRKYHTDPETGRRFAALEAQRRDLVARQAVLDATTARLGGEQLAELDRRIAATSKGIKSGATAETVAHLREQRQALLDRVLDPETKQRLKDTSQALAEVDAALARLPAPSLVYAGTVHHGSGAFRGTGPDGGKPREVRILRRGDVKQPGELVGPGALKAVAELPARFQLPEGHTEGERRAALAKWITDPNNPLTWRSIVNRVWQYHFGRGIVETANDFGRMGQLPTHPELLDWLAVEFRAGGQSLKRLHRLIVTSSTYRQTSNGGAGFQPAHPLGQVGNLSPQAIDAGNAYLWRMNRRRLEAEAIRDSVLFVSGKLDPRLYGPGFQDFVIEKPEHSPHYQYHLHDPEDPRSHRRSVYRFLVRSQQQPFMTTLDCADPSLQVERRNETLSALQALALLNNQFMLAQSRHLAAHVEQLGANPAEQVTAAFRLALGRPPTAAEREALTAYAREHGMANACRVILNLNEFVFVD
jgi:hypothetical protein